MMRDDDDRLLSFLDTPQIHDTMHTYWYSMEEQPPARPGTRARSQRACGRAVGGERGRKRGTNSFTCLGLIIGLIGIASEVKHVGERAVVLHIPHALDVAVRT